MKNEKETMITPEAEEAAKKHVTDLVNTPAPVTDSELDDEFAIDSDLGDELDDETLVSSNNDWKFPGPRVARLPFMSNGRRMYSYHTQLRHRSGKKNLDGSDHYLILRAELRVADKKNRDAYDLLDLLFQDLPQDQNYLLLGFQYQDFTKNYIYSVRREINGVPVSVSLVPRDSLSRDNLQSMIVKLKNEGKL